jgi:hypothetical protein
MPHSEDQVLEHPALLPASSDWGDLSEEDKQENEFSLVHSFRLLSSYPLDNGTTIWLVTEADRSPEEY